MKKTILSTAIALTLGLSSMNALAETNTGDIVQETVVMQPERTVTPQQADMISGYAAKALLHIARARGAIHDKNLSVAEKELGQAHAYLELVKAKRPTAKVLDEVNIAKAHLEYAELDTVADDLVPIYSDLTVLGELVPVGQARQNLDSASQALKKGDKSAAKAALGAVAESLIYTEIDLPVSSTEHHIATAQDYIRQGNYKKADQVLAAAEDNVVYLSYDRESPIAEARDNLFLAGKDYAAKHYDDVKKDLIRAKKWLEVARTRVDRNSVAVDEYETINRLEGDIEKISVSLDKKHNNLAGSIEGALHKLKAMAEREAEKISIGWKTKRPDTDVRADLIDAKQHVAFAENMQFYAKSDPDDIFQALDRAKAELDKVAKSGKLDGKASSELNLVTKDLAMIREKPDNRGVYERIRARLRGLIHNNY
ncbi:YfdX family protein [Thiolapillus sp.]